MAESGRSATRRRAADVLTIFGITGDLAKKMTFRALYRLEARGQARLPDRRRRDRRLGRRAAARARPRGDRRDRRRAPTRTSSPASPRGSPTSRATTPTPTPSSGSAKALGDAKRPVFYLEIPPVAVRHRGRAASARPGLTENARVVIEKPFGHDLESARALNAELHEVLREEQILRIDHYLGKEPVMDITYLRFANSILEPVWNREHVSHVQMTIAEDFGVDDRGRFYDAVGAMRDVIQNHALQVLGAGRDGAAGRQPAGLDPRQEAGAVQGDARPPTRSATCAASTTASSRSRTSRRTRPPRPSPRSSWRSTTGAGAASRSSSAPARTCRSRRARSTSSSSGRRGSASAAARLPEPNQMTVRIEPEAGRADPALRQEGRRGGLRAGRPRGAVREGARRGPRALRAPARRRARRPHPALHPRGRGRGDLADRRSRCSTSRGPVHPYEPGTWGPKEADEADPRASASGTSPGCPTLADAA